MSLSTVFFFNVRDGKIFSILWGLHTENILSDSIQLELYISKAITTSFTSECIALIPPPLNAAIPVLLIVAVGREATISSETGCVLLL